MSAEIGDGVHRLVNAASSLIKQSYPDRAVHMIINPVAGTHGYHEKALSACELLGAEHRWTDQFVDGIHVTEYPGHATEIVQGLMDEASPEHPLVIVSIGGDGTHNEVMQPVAAGAAKRAGIPGDTSAPSERSTEENAVTAYYRIPFGSGNDGADGTTLNESLNGLKSVLTLTAEPMVWVTTNELARAAFNIASVGIDAYITLVRQKLKPLFPGNTYRLITDATVLFYEYLEKLGDSQIEVITDDGRTLVRTSRHMLLAFGASGFRTYGNHMNVLPGEENLCVIDHDGLFTKLKMKKLFFKGDHVHEPLTTMLKAGKITIRYSRRLAVQLDGEPMWVPAEQFPIHLQRVPGAIPVLAPARIA